MHNMDKYLESDTRNASLSFPERINRLYKSLKTFGTTRTGNVGLAVGSHELQIARVVGSPCVHDITQCFQRTVNGKAIPVYIQNNCRTSP